MEEQNKEKLWWIVGIVGTIALIAVIFAVLPAIIRKITDLKFRSKSKVDDDEIASMGPKIVEKE